MLGSGILLFATPLALGYALHARRAGGSMVAATIALALALLEALAFLALAALWFRARFLS